MEAIDAIPSLPPDLLRRGRPAEAIGLTADGKLPADAEKLRDVAKKFEGVFLHQVLKQMKAATAELEADSESEDPSGEQVKGMYWDFLADAMTERGGFGFWKQIHKQLSELTGSSAAPAQPRLDETI